uniref:Uncharacterized protein n=1 Tax=Romanomermis culicivorax TaxID=13658 RepID=A0A915HTJ0_ROMCU
MNNPQQPRAQNNLSETRQQMNRKILKALMVNTIAQSITFLVAYSKLINGLFQENRDVKIMPYFVNLMMIDAFINFVIYVFYIDQFRRTLLNAVLCRNRVIQ